MSYLPGPNGPLLGVQGVLPGSAAASDNPGSGTGSTAETIVLASLADQTAGVAFQVSGSIDGGGTSPSLALIVDGGTPIPMSSADPYDLTFAGETISLTTPAAQTAGIAFPMSGVVSTVPTGAAFALIVDGGTPIPMSSADPYDFTVASS